MAIFPKQYGLLQNRHTTEYVCGNSGCTLVGKDGLVVRFEFPLTYFIFHGLCHDSVVVRF